MIMTPEQEHKYLKELHELSPEPLHSSWDYFDNEEQKYGTDKDTQSETRRGDIS